jgi:hypothetical protein
MAGVVDVLHGRRHHHHPRQPTHLPACSPPPANLATVIRARCLGACTILLSQGAGTVCRPRAGRGRCLVERMAGEGRDGAGKGGEEAEIAGRRAAFMLPEAHLPPAPRTCHELHDIRAGTHTTSRRATRCSQQLSPRGNLPLAATGATPSISHAAHTSLWVDMRCAVDLTSHARGLERTKTRRQTPGERARPKP